MTATKTKEILLVAMLSSKLADREYNTVIGQESNARAILTWYVSGAHGRESAHHANENPEAGQMPSTKPIGSQGRKRFADALVQFPLIESKTRKSGSAKFKSRPVHIRFKIRTRPRRTTGMLPDCVKGIVARPQAAAG